MRVHSRWRDGGHIFDDLLGVCVWCGGGSNINEPWSRVGGIYFGR